MLTENLFYTFIDSTGKIMTTTISLGSLPPDPLLSTAHSWSSQELCGVVTIIILILKGIS